MRSPGIALALLALPGALLQAAETQTQTQTAPDRPLAAVTPGATASGGETQAAALPGGAALADADRVAALRRALARQPEAPAPRFALAQLLARQGDHAEAVRQYQQLLRRYPQDVDYLFGLGQVRLWQGQPAAASVLLARARALAPHYAAVWQAEWTAWRAQEGAVAQARAERLRLAAARRFPGAAWVQSRPPAALAAAGVSRAAAADSSLLPPPEMSSLPPPAVDPAPAAIFPPHPAGAAAADSRPAPATGPRWAIEAQSGAESLNRGQAPWRNHLLRGELLTPGQDDAPPALRAYVSLRETERFRRGDQDIAVGGLWPLRPDWTLQLEAGGSPAHHILPAGYGQWQLFHRPAPGWALFGGWREAVYASGRTQVTHFGLDHYVDRERLGYTLYLGGPVETAVAPSHRWQWAHHYNAQDFVALTLTRGRESEQTTNGFLSSRVEGISLSGRQSLAPGWQGLWEIGQVRQGSFYTRQGLQLGLRHTF